MHRPAARRAFHRQRRNYRPLFHFAGGQLLAKLLAQFQHFNFNDHLVRRVRLYRPMP